MYDKSIVLWIPHLYFHCTRIQSAQAKLLYIASEQEYFLNPMVCRPGLPGSAVESTAATTVVAKGRLWTLEFKQNQEFII